MKKKAIALSTVIILILALFVVGIGYNVIMVLKDVGEEGIDTLWPEEGNFSPFKFGPKTAREINVDNSIKALICSINAITYFDSIYEAEKDNGHMEEIKREDFFNTHYSSANFWENSCGNIVPTSLDELDESEVIVVDEVEGEGEVEISSNNGQKCYDAYGFCVYREYAPSGPGNMYFYKDAKYNAEDITTCPQETPYCQMVCPLEIRSTCKPDETPVKHCGSGWGYGDNIQYCMKNGYYCQQDCKDGCLEEGGKVYCEENKLDIETMIKTNAEQARIFGSVDCTGGKQYGGSCVKCSYDYNPPYFKCYVNNFNLPQSGFEDKSFLENWVAGIGDPEYVVYYEAFPQGEEAYWQVDYGSMTPLALYGGAVASIILPVNPNLITKAVNIKSVGLKAVLAETTIGSLVSFGVRQAKLFKQNLFFLKIKNKDLVFKLQLMQDAMDNFGGKLNPFKEFGELDSTEFLPIYRKYIDDAGKISDETALFTEMADEVNRQWVKTYTGTLTPAELSTQSGTYSQIFLDEAIKPTLASNIDIAAARIARTFDIPLATFFGKGKLSEEALNTYLDTAVKRSEDIQTIFKSGFLNKNVDQLAYFNKLSSGLDMTLDSNVKFGAQIDEIIKSLEKTNRVNDVANFLFTKTPLRVPADLAKFEYKLARIGLTPFNTKNRWATLLLITWMADLIESENDKFLPHGVNTMVLRSPSMFGYGYEYDLESATPYTIIIKNEGTDKNGYKRFYLASPCEADLEVSKVNFYQTLSAKTFWGETAGADNIMKYDIYNFGSGYSIVNKGTLAYAQPPSPVKVQEKISDSPDYLTIITTLKNIDSSFSSINGNTDLALIFSIGTKRFDSGEIEKALNIFMILAKYYPYSYETIRPANNTNVYIDGILSNPELFLKIDPVTLKEIAFEELTTKEERARFFAPLMKDTGEFDCISYDTYLNFDPGPGMTCEERLANYLTVDTHLPQYVFNRNGNNFYQLIYEYNMRLRSIYENAYLSWFYFDISGVDVSRKDDGLSGDKATYRDINKWVSFSYEERKEEYYKAYDELVTRLTEGFDPDKDTFWCLTDEGWGINFGTCALSSGGSLPSYGGTLPNYESGNILIPIHIKYAKTEIDDKLLPTYYNMISFVNEYEAIYNRYLSDTDISNDRDSELLDKKEFFEKKAELGEGWFEKEDLRKWFEISEEIIDRGLITDSSMAIKGVEDINLAGDGDTFPDDVIPLNSWGIQLYANLEEGTDPNYCYQAYDPKIQAIINTLSVSSMFLDDVVGALFAAGCGLTGVGATMVTVCYKVGAAAFNLISAHTIQELQKLRKWPKRGDV